MTIWTTLRLEKETFKLNIYAHRNWYLPLKTCDLLGWMKLYIRQFIKHFYYIKGKSVCVTRLSIVLFIPRGIKHLAAMDRLHSDEWTLSVHSLQRYCLILWVPLAVCSLLEIPAFAVSYLLKFVGAVSFLFMVREVGTGIGLMQLLPTAVFECKENLCSVLRVCQLSAMQFHSPAALPTSPYVWGVFKDRNLPSAC